MNIAVKSPKRCDVADNCCKISETLRESCCKISETLRDNCYKISETLRESCCKISETLRDHCRNVAGVILHRNIAEMLQESSYVRPRATLHRNVTATFLQPFCNGVEQRPVLDKVGGPYNRCVLKKGYHEREVQSSERIRIGKICRKSLQETHLLHSRVENMIYVFREGQFRVYDDTEITDGINWHRRSIVDGVIEGSGALTTRKT